MNRYDRERLVFWMFVAAIVIVTALTLFFVMRDENRAQDACRAGGGRVVEIRGAYHGWFCDDVFHGEQEKP